MTMSSIGDLAQTLMLRNRSSMLSQRMAALTDELASGQVSNVARHLDGDVVPLLRTDADLARLDGFGLAASEAKGTADAMQTSLGQIQSAQEELAAALISGSTGGNSAGKTATAALALTTLDTILSALNTSVAGRSLFSGTATDRAPMGTGESLLDALAAELSLSSSADDIRAAAEAWFDNPDGFGEIAYKGSQQALSPVMIGVDETVSLSIRADDGVFKDLLLDVSLVALAGRDDLSLSDESEDVLRQDAGARLMATDNLTGVRAELGYTQARIENAIVRNSASRASLEMARSVLLEADPYETALQLEEVQFQLESLYTVTARNARLSLLSYLE